MNTPISRALLLLSLFMILLVSRIYSADSTVPIWQYTVVNTFPHDPQAFTQGLLYADGSLYESTGLNGQSSLRKVELATGKVTKIHYLPVRHFGEGLTLWKNTLIQLTWHSGVAFVYEKEDFHVKKIFHYTGEGWGLTHDASHLIMSNGSSKLHFLNPDTFKENRSIEVKDQGVPVTRLNELEYIHGEIYANIWLTNRIARISPQTGEVLGWIDLTGLLSKEEQKSADVLNGIAYDAEHDRLFVTGKNWPKIFEIKLCQLEGR